jgi:hypothetical protein
MNNYATTFENIVKKKNADIANFVNTINNQNQTVIDLFGSSDKIIPKSIFRKAAMILKKEESSFKGAIHKFKRKEKTDILLNIKLPTPGKSEIPRKQTLRAKLSEQKYQTNILKFEKSITVDKLRELNALFGINSIDTYYLLLK